jgi:hypothetical protein
MHTIHVLLGYGVCEFTTLKRRRGYNLSERTYNPGRNYVKHMKFSVATVNALCIVLVQAYIIHPRREETWAGMMHINKVPHTMDSVQREESPVTGHLQKTCAPFLLPGPSTTRYVILLSGFRKGRG